VSSDTAAPSDTVAGDVGEIAIVVEDAQQRIGIGTRLLAMLLEHADRNGMGIVKASVHAERAWVVGMLRGYGPCSARVSSGVYDVTMRRASRWLPPRTAGPDGGSWPRTGRAG
jgi:GNAT superfamily N-acetyltransferase